MLTLAARHHDYRIIKRLPISEKSAYFRNQTDVVQPPTNTVGQPVMITPGVNGTPTPAVFFANADVKTKLETFKQFDVDES